MEKRIVPEPQNIAQPNSDLTGPVKRKPQFSIRHLLVWTTIVSVGVVITTATLSVNHPDLQVPMVIISISIYMMAVCGLWMLVKKQRSFDFWFPAGMSVFLPVFFLLYSAGIPRIPGQIGDPLLEGISAVILCLGVPYGIGLLVLITRRTSKSDFSFTMLVFYVGCWLWWVACAAIGWVGASGAML